MSRDELRIGVSAKWLPNCYTWKCFGARLSNASVYVFELCIEMEVVVESMKSMGYTNNVGIVTRPS